MSYEREKLIDGAMSSSWREMTDFSALVLKHWTDQEPKDVAAMAAAIVCAAEEEHEADLARKRECAAKKQAGPA